MTDPTAPPVPSDRDALLAAARILSTSGLLPLPWPPGVAAPAADAILLARWVVWRHTLAPAEPPAGTLRP